MKAEHYIPFQLQVLTPVHIGSGDVFTPLSYIVRNPREGEYEICLVDGQAWLCCHASEKLVAKALADGDMASLRSLINNAGDIKLFTQAKINIPSPSLGQALINDRANINKNAFIQTFIRNPFTRQPYLPASSLKGAISTALAFYINTKRRKLGLAEICNAQGTEDRRALEEIYGKIGSHAMRALRLADMAIPPNRTRICKAVGKDLVPPGKPERINCETLNPGAGKGANITGLMRLFSSADPKCMGQSGSRAYIQLHNPNENIDANKMWQICSDFYKDRFLKEFDKFYKLPDFQATGKALQEIKKKVESLAPDEMLLRIGRFSHIECMTVSGVPKGKKAWGTSRTLADALLPFGWVILKRCSMELYEKGQAEIVQAFAKEAAQEEAIGLEREKLMAAMYKNQSAEAEALRQRREEEEKKARELAEAKRLRQEEAEKREREEAALRQKREEKLATMESWQEKAIYLLGEAGTDDMALEMHAKLDEYGDWQIKAAEALKAYWEASGKWSGKALSQKQAEKVKKVKVILGISEQAPVQQQGPKKDKKKKKKKN